MTTSDGHHFDRDALHGELDRLAERTAHDLAQRRAVRVASRETVRALPLLLVVPGLVILYRGIEWLGRETVPAAEPRGLLTGTLAFALLAILPVAAWVAYRWWSTLGRRASRERALAVLDRHLGLADRLSTADEFIELDARGPFELAAIEDAGSAARRARGAVLPEVVYAPRFERSGLLTIAAALLLCLGAAAFRFDVVERDRPDDPDRDRVAALDGGAAAERSAREAAGDEDVPEVTTEEPRERKPRPPQDAMRADAQATTVPEQIKKGEGTTREGQSSDAQSASGSGQAKGSPSNQEQKSLGESKPKKEPDKPSKPSEPKKDEEQAPKTADEDSGSTAGRGAAKGSNKNSVASPWSSKDHVDTPEDEEIEDDDEFEDDAEEQKSRGGMQPNLRDRRPPVSRDLSIGMGNRPSPDANGRGGPSDQKKSRGTASLVLGVPVPDRVKGQPNRGKTKITQERIEPRAENSDPVVAGDRAPSTTPIGSVPSPFVSPRVRETVRQYFLELRERRERTNSE
ncbi:MAG: hypothetical protein R3F34_20785 [Planctomycetota bacterium]